MTQNDVLRELYSSDDFTLTANELAGKIGVTSGSVTNCLSSLIKFGFVSVDYRDVGTRCRRAEYTLTKKGRETYKRQVVNESAKNEKE